MLSSESDGANMPVPEVIVDSDSIDIDPPLNSNQDPQCSYSQEDSKSPPTNKQALNDGPKHSKTEDRATPRRALFANSKSASKQKQAETASTSRSCEQHTFLTDITEVRQMEQGLLKLLDDFHLGKLQAFGKDCTFEKMEQVREQQERLARLHFELNAQQEIYGAQSEDERRVGRENLGKLIENLQQLSRSIEQLQISSPSFQTDV
ncbi:hypothetical protein JTE90_004437 [Oedothorax gibbosus]|uniref:Coiled-coil domain-containing protein 28B n=1 Tax=Oedothorax gibbosus TaxID=931172 RepID=A0AAV6UNI0_9ARAC|nr:hypothetical protein JTE90_004437 [Oedothorax gibbosus]